MLMEFGTPIQFAAAYAVARFVFGLATYTQLTPLVLSSAIVGVAIGAARLGDKRSSYGSRVRRAPRPRLYGLALAFCLAFARLASRLLMILSNFFFSASSTSSGIVFARLRHWNERERKQQEIVSTLFPDFSAIPYALVFPINVPSLGQGSQSDVQVVLKSPTASLEELGSVVDAAVARVERAGATTKPAGTDPEMAAELRRAREDYETLKGKTDGAAARLDAAIGRLNGILGEAAE